MRINIEQLYDDYLKIYIPIHTSENTKEECKLPTILNFYDCTFNFDNKDAAKSKNISDNKKYNTSKEN